MINSKTWEEHYTGNRNKVCLCLSRPILPSREILDCDIILFPGKTSKHRRHIGETKMYCIILKASLKLNICRCRRYKCVLSHLSSRVVLCTKSTSNLWHKKGQGILLLYLLTSSGKFVFKYIAYFKFPVSNHTSWFWPQFYQLFG